jgi:hypothetical protein
MPRREEHQMFATVVSLVVVVAGVPAFLFLLSGRV